MMFNSALVKAELAVNISIYLCIYKCMMFNSALVKAELAELPLRLYLQETNSFKY